MSATNSLHYQLCTEGAKWLRRRKRMLYSRIFRRGFKAGAEWMYNELMKGLCFETKVYLEDDGCAEDFNYMEWLALENTEITDVPFDTLELKAGDKVKIIIVKEG